MQNKEVAAQAHLLVRGNAHEDILRLINFLNLGIPRVIQRSAACHVGAIDSIIECFLPSLHYEELEACDMREVR